MWRRGERLYALLVFLVVVLESLALGGLVAVFSGRLFNLFGYPVAYQALFCALLLTGVALSLLSAYILLYHAYTASRESYERKLYETWLTRFTEALFAGEAPPRPPWPRPALEALLNLREILKGEFSERITEWLRQANLPWPRILRARLTSRPLRLEALEALAQARLPETLEVILPYLAHPDPVLRLAAARAGARVAQGDGVLDLANALLEAALPRGALLEVLLLLEDRGGPVVEYFLTRGGQEEVWAALEAVGRMKLSSLAEKVLAFLDHPDPELRAAAMRALYRLRYLPQGYEGVLLGALKDPEEFLRVHAARLLALLNNELAQRALWKALADPSFYVRRAAAEGLLLANRDLLVRAAEAHPDPYGKAMAQQVLREAA
ncbi:MULTISPECIES: HEAT repeat domain-containing protein [Thermus]|uniref:HEAT repeat domain-containing protein n=1 Tax=Thermus TaxID=270 RepID=UPI001EFBF3A0|nr:MULTISPECIES: HEAT repeat domain-containing protein [Thermus]ULR40303.1 HEAT repeat domain-containing protein [Thermus sp. NEB1569]